jgi:MSHA biogenesis protein MshL
MNPAAFHRRLLIACALLLLGGCAAQTPPNTALASIGQQLAAPAPRTPAAPVPAAVRQAIEQAAPVEAPANWLPEPRFDLSVVNAPAPQVFLAIASDTRYSMLLPPNLPGTITVNLKDVTVREAMESLRELYGYEYRIEGKRVFVQSQALQTRLFRVNYLSIKRQGQSDVRVSSGSLNSSSAPGAAGGALPGGGYPAGGSPGVPGAGSRSVEASRLVTTTDSDFWATMSASLSAIVGTEGGRGVVVNPMAGIIVVRALALEQRQVEAFLRAMQISVERQVMLEAKIVEVSLRDGFQSGINWGAFDSSGRHRFSVGADTNAINQDRTTQGSLSQLLGSGLSTATGRAASGLFGLAFQTGSFQSMLQFLESQGSVHVLSNPRIATLNNQKAVLKVGTDDFFVTNVATNTTSPRGPPRPVHPASRCSPSSRGSRWMSRRRSTSTTTSSCTCTRQSAWCPNATRTSIWHDGQLHAAAGLQQHQRNRQHRARARRCDRRHRRSDDPGAERFAGSDSRRRRRALCWAHCSATAAAASPSANW